MIDNVIRFKLQTFLLQTKRRTEQQSETIIRFAEDSLPLFVRKYMDGNFADIYTQTKHEAYAKWRECVFDNPEDAKENEAADDRYTETLKLLTDFFDSTTFKGKPKAVLTAFEKQAKNAASHNKAKQKDSQPKPDPMMPPSDEEEELTEGKIRQVNLTRHERNPRLRQLCLQHYGYQCQVCGMDFETRYGEIGKDFIEVHHLNPIAETDGEHALDPMEGLVPLCSNCHSMIHRGGNGGKPMSLQTLKEIYQTHNNKD